MLQLADTNQDGKLSAEEIKQNDALEIVRDAVILIMHGTADGSKGSGLIHHKFLVIDGKTVIITSANFTITDIHGDFQMAGNRGNPNNLVKI